MILYIFIVTDLALTSIIGNLIKGYFKLYIFKPPEETSLPSKLELLFLLDSGGYICVLNLPIFTKLVDHFLNCSKSSPTKNDFKTLTVANKAEVLIIFFCDSHISYFHSRKYSLFCSSICSCKHQIHYTGKSFFEKHVKTQY